jgi:hypothetical protein
MPENGANKKAGARAPALLRRPRGNVGFDSSTNVDVSRSML